MLMTLSNALDIFFFLTNLLPDLSIKLLNNFVSYVVHNDDLITKNQRNFPLHAYTIGVLSFILILIFTLTTFSTPITLVIELWIEY